MKQLGLVLIMFFTTSLKAQIPAVLEEALYYDFQKSILSEDKGIHKSFLGFTHFEQSLLVDALWDLVEEKSPAALKTLQELDTFHLSLSEKLRIAILKIQNKQLKKLPRSLHQEIVNSLKSPEEDIKLIYLIAAFEQDLLKAGHKSLIDLAQTHPHYFDLVSSEDKNDEVSNEIVSDLFHAVPDITSYMNGEYATSVKVFMFCRTNRLYPCLMVMKDMTGEAVRFEDGTLWNHKSLASSARGLPSYSRNGNTPAGILTIDSVMPVADEPISFGKFRRMILNFIPPSKDEKFIKTFLPASSLEHEWWKPSVMARDIGRNLLRIHGTGKINSDPSTPYFPFMRTSGCIAQRENTYQGITYQDQRDLLDAMMKGLELDPSYENEVKIKGILYVVEIDERPAAVELADLKLRGIE